MLDAELTGLCQLASPSILRTDVTSLHDIKYEETVEEYKSR